jgi:hypothetical protein
MPTVQPPQKILRLLRVLTVEPEMILSHEHKGLQKMLATRVGMLVFGIVSVILSRIRRSAGRMQSLPTTTAMSLSFVRAVDAARRAAV